MLETGHRWICAALLMQSLVASGGATGSTSRSIAQPLLTRTQELGLASFYHDKYHGKPTASGETFGTNQLTAAHRTLPFGTIVRVTAMDGNRSVIVRINDRGPFVSGRCIDLSRAAARELKFEKSGLLKVKVEVLRVPKLTAARQVIRLPD